MSIDVTRSDTLSERVAEEIRALSARRRVTGRELARRLGVSAAWVSYRLTGQQPIDLNDLERIAEALGVSVVDLLPRDRREVTVTYVDPVINATRIDRSVSAHSPMRLARPTDRRPGTRTDGSGPPSGPRRTSPVGRSSPV